MPEIEINNVSHWPEFGEVDADKFEKFIADIDNATMSAINTLIEIGHQNYREFQNAEKISLLYSPEEGKQIQTEFQEARINYERLNKIEIIKREEDINNYIKLIESTENAEQKRELANKLAKLKQSLKTFKEPYAIIKKNRLKHLQKEQELAERRKNEIIDAISKTTNDESISELEVNLSACDDIIKKDAYNEALEDYKNYEEGHYNEALKQQLFSAKNNYNQFTEQLRHAKETYFKAVKKKDRLEKDISTFNWHKNRKQMLENDGFWDAAFEVTVGNERRILEELKRNWHQHGQFAHLNPIALHKAAKHLLHCESALEKAQQTFDNAIRNNPESAKTHGAIIKQYLEYFTKTAEILKHQKQSLAYAMYMRLVSVEQTGSDDLLAETVKLTGEKVPAFNRFIVNTDLIALYKFIKKHGDNKLQSKLANQFKIDKSNRIVIIRKHYEALAQINQTLAEIPLPIATNDYVPNWNLIYSDLWKALSNQQLDLEKRKRIANTYLQNDYDDQTNKLIKRLIEDIKIQERLLLWQRTELFSLALDNINKHELQLSQATSSTYFWVDLENAMKHLEQQMRTNSLSIKTETLLKIKEQVNICVDKIRDAQANKKTKLDVGRYIIKNEEFHKELSKQAFWKRIQKPIFDKVKDLEDEQNEHFKLASEIYELAKEYEKDKSSPEFVAYYDSYKNHLNISKSKGLQAQKSMDEFLVLTQLEKDWQKSDKYVFFSSSALLDEANYLAAEEKRLLNWIDKVKNKKDNILLNNQLKLVNNRKTALAYAMSKRLELMGRGEQFNDDISSGIFEKLKELNILDKKARLESRKATKPLDIEVISKFYKYITNHGDQEIKKQLSKISPFKTLVIVPTVRKPKNVYILPKEFRKYIPSALKRRLSWLSTADKWRSDFLKEKEKHFFDIDQLLQTDIRSIHHDSWKKLSRMQNKVNELLEKNNNTTKPPSSWFTRKKNDALQLRWSIYLTHQQTNLLNKQMEFLENLTGVNIQHNNSSHQLLLKQLNNKITFEADLMFALDELSDHAKNGAQKARIEKIKNSYRKNTGILKDPKYIATRLKELAPSQNKSTTENHNETTNIRTQFDWLFQIHGQNLPQKYQDVIKNAITDYYQSLLNYLQTGISDAEYFIEYENLLLSLSEAYCSESIETLKLATERRKGLEGLSPEKSENYETQLIKKIDFIVNEFKLPNNERENMGEFASRCWDTEAFAEFNNIFQSSTVYDDIRKFFSLGIEMTAHPIWQKMMSAQATLSEQLEATFTYSSKKVISEQLIEWNQYIKEQQAKLFERQMQFFSDWLLYQNSAMNPEDKFFNKNITIDINTLNHNLRYFEYLFGKDVLIDKLIQVINDAIVSLDRSLTKSSAKTNQKVAIAQERFLEEFMLPEHIQAFNDVQMKRLELTNSQTQAGEPNLSWKVQLFKAIELQKQNTEQLSDSNALWEGLFFMQDQLTDNLEKLKNQVTFQSEAWKQYINTHQKSFLQTQLMILNKWVDLPFEEIISSAQNLDDLSLLLTSMNKRITTFKEKTKNIPNLNAQESQYNDETIKKVYARIGQIFYTKTLQSIIAINKFIAGKSDSFPEIEFNHLTTDWTNLTSKEKSELNDTIKLLIDSIKVALDNAFNNRENLDIESAAIKQLIACSDWLRTTELAPQFANVMLDTIQTYYKRFSNRQFAIIANEHEAAFETYEILLTKIAPQYSTKVEHAKTHRLYQGLTDKLSKDEQKVLFEQEYEAFIDMFEIRDKDFHQFAKSWKPKLFNELDKLLNTDINTQTFVTDLTESEFWRKLKQIQFEIYNERQSLPQSTILNDVADEWQVFLNEQQTLLLNKQIEMFKHWMDTLVEDVLYQDIHPNLDVNMLYHQLHELSGYVGKDAHLFEQIDEIIKSTIYHYYENIAKTVYSISEQKNLASNDVLLIDEYLGSNANDKPKSSMNIQSALDIENILAELISPDEVNTLAEAQVLRQRSIGTSLNTNNQWKLTLPQQINGLVKEIDALMSSNNISLDKYQQVWNTASTLQTHISEQQKEINNDYSHKWSDFLKNNQLTLLHKQMEFLNKWTTSSSNLTNMPVDNYIAMNNAVIVLLDQTNQLGLNKYHMAIQDHIKPRLKNMLLKHNDLARELFDYSELFKSIRAAFKSENFILGKEDFPQAEFDDLIKYNKMLGDKIELEFSHYLNDLLDDFATALKNAFKNRDRLLRTTDPLKAFEQLKTCRDLFAQINVNALNNKIDHVIENYYIQLSNIDLTKEDQGEFAAYENLLEHIATEQKDKIDKIKNLRLTYFKKPQAKTNASLSDAHNTVQSIIGPIDLNNYDQAMKFAKIWKPIFNDLNTLLTSQNATAQPSDLELWSTNRIAEIKTMLHDEIKKSSKSFLGAWFKDKQWLEFLNKSQSKLEKLDLETKQLEIWESLMKQTYDKIFSISTDEISYDHASLQKIEKTLELLRNQLVDISKWYKSDKNEIIKRLHTLNTSALNTQHQCLIALAKTVQISAQESNLDDLKNAKSLLRLYTSSKTLLKAWVSVEANNTDPNIINVDDNESISNEIEKSLQETKLRIDDKIKIKTRTHVTEFNTEHDLIFSHPKGKQDSPGTVDIEDVKNKNPNNPDNIP